jgi:hypothetical protein
MPSPRKNHAKTRSVRPSPVDLLAEHMVRHKALREAGRAEADPGRRPAPSARMGHLLPVETYLSSGRKRPEGTPRQTRWAAAIKARAWPGLARAVRAEFLDRDPHIEYGVIAAARVGYPPEVAPLLRAACLVRVMDMIDALDARFWIDMVVGPVRVFGAPPGAAGPRGVRTAVFRPSRPPDPEWVARSLRPVLRPLFLEFIEGYPTPDDWRAELRRRGLRHDPEVTEQDRRYFERFGPGGSESGA